MMRKLQLCSSLRSTSQKERLAPSTDGSSADIFEYVASLIIANNGVQSLGKMLDCNLPRILSSYLCSSPSSHPTL